jgi:hypothetical protein
VRYVLYVGSVCPGMPDVNLSTCFRNPLFFHVSGMAKPKTPYKKKRRKRQHGGQSKAAKWRKYTAKAAQRNGIMPRREDITWRGDTRQQSVRDSIVVGRVRKRDRTTLMRLCRRVQRSGFGYIPPHLGPRGGAHSLLYTDNACKRLLDQVCKSTGVPMTFSNAYHHAVDDTPWILKSDGVGTVHRDHDLHPSGRSLKTLACCLQSDAPFRFHLWTSCLSTDIYAGGDPLWESKFLKQHKPDLTFDLEAGSFLTFPAQLVHLVEADVDSHRVMFSGFGV